MRVLKGVENKLGVASGTFFLTVTTLIIKIVGALYKVPLFNLLKSDGMGLYQMVFPLFALCITLSGGYATACITKLISSGYNAECVLKKSLQLFIPLGILLFSILFILGEVIARAQGNELGGALYKAISPALIFTSVICCFRGYFQGYSDYKPTAISQIVEQVVKVAVALVLIWAFNAVAIRGAIFACLAVTVSEGTACFYLVTLYFKRKKTLVVEGEQISKSKLFFASLPLCFTSLCMPLATFSDSFIVINGLKNFFGENATAIYGLYAGGVETVITLPVNFLHSFVCGFLPKLCRSNESGMQKKMFILVAAVAFIFSAAVYIFAPFAVKLLYKASENRQLLTNLIRAASFNVLLLSLLQTSSTALLVANGQYFSLLSMPIAVAVKIYINLKLVPTSKFNVFGVVISDFACYFVALSLNLLYIYYSKKSKNEGRKNENYSRGIRNGLGYRNLARLKSNKKCR